MKPDRGCEVRTALEANCTFGNGAYVDCYINVNYGLLAVDQWMCSVPENGSLYRSNTVIVRKDGKTKPCISNFIHTIILLSVDHMNMSYYI